MPPAKNNPTPNKPAATTATTATTDAATKSDTPPPTPQEVENARIAKAKVEEAAKAAAEVEAKELDFIGSPVLLTPDLVKQSAPKNARSPRQIKMDETVAALHKSWLQKGQPGTWVKAVNAKVVATYFVDPENAADHKKLIAKAAAYLGVGIRWGNPFVATPELVHKYSLPDSYVGREVISFFVRSHRTRTTTTNTTLNR